MIKRIFFWIISFSLIELSDLYAQMDNMFSYNRIIYNKVDTLMYRFAEPVNTVKNKDYPLVVFLHGIGERGNDNCLQLKHGAQEFVNAYNQKKNPSYVLVPQCPDGKKWVNVDGGLEHHVQPDTISDILQAVVHLIDSLKYVYPIDSNRIYITGISMGGFGTWDVITRFPDFFAAALPVCGGADENKAKVICHIPIWAFHGAQDKVVLPSRSINMIKAIRNSKGKKSKCTIYSNLGHDCWTKTYNRKNIYKWLFRQKKTRNKKDSFYES